MGFDASYIKVKGKCHNDDTKSKIGIRQIKYLNNIVEQDHRAVKRVIRSMMGFKSFWYAANTIAGIKLVHMLRKGQMKEDAMDLGGINRNFLCRRSNEVQTILKS